MGNVELGSDGNCGFRRGYEVKTEDSMLGVGVPWSRIYIWGADHICYFQVRKGVDIPICDYPDSSQEDCPYLEWVANARHLRGTGISE